MSGIVTPMEGFSFGCDPELFVFNEKNEPVPADMIPGTKEEPHPVKFGAVQRDGMAAEFNIDPATNFADFNRNINSVMKTLQTFLPEGYTLSAVPAVRFDPTVFDSAPDAAKALGCSPDFNAWTGEINPPPCDPDDPYLRTASGHVHIGWGEDLDLADAQHIMNCQDLVKQLDWYLGAWSVKMDTDPTRRKLYGRAGAYRPKTYGVEYRVLSNFWITTRDRRLAMWNRLQIAIHQMRKKCIPEIYGPDNNNAIVNYINETKRDSVIENAYRFPLMTVEPYLSRY